MSESADSSESHEAGPAPTKELDSSLTRLLNRATESQLRAELTRVLLMAEAALVSDIERSLRASSKKLCFFDVSVNKEVIGRIKFELYDELVPKTSENFRALCRGDEGNMKSGRKLVYKGCPFHRIIPGFMIQGGDITNGDGTGGMSIYGRSFSDESLTMKHDKPYLLSMANSGPNTNGSQFFITTAKAKWLDGKHVVFGRVVEGETLVQRMERCGTKEGKPKARVAIANCGECDA